MQPYDADKTLGILVAIAIMALVLCQGCSTYLPATGPLTAMSAGLHPSEVVQMQSTGTGTDGLVTPRVVKKKASPIKTVLHYGLMALEGYGYYMLYQNLAQDDNRSDFSQPPTPDHGSVTVGDNSTVGRIDTLQAPVVIGANVIAGDINTGPPLLEE